MINHSCRRVKKENATFEAVQNSSHKNPLNPSHQTFHTTHLHLTSRRILVSKVFIALAFDESVHPRKLRFLLAELPVQVCVCVAVDTVFGTSVGLALIGVVEPSNGQYSYRTSPEDLDQLTYSHDLCTPPKPPTSCAQSPTCRYRFPGTVAELSRSRRFQCR